MPLMRYKAVDERGRKRTGEMEAANPADLEARLARLGLDLIAFREVKARNGLRPARRARVRSRAQRPAPHLAHPGRHRHVRHRIPISHCHAALPFGGGTPL